MTSTATRTRTTTGIGNTTAQPVLPGLLFAAIALLASVFLAYLTFLQPGAPLSPGLDSSWAYGLNYVFQHKLVLGQDIYFTFGPLGFLEHTRGLTVGILDISTGFWFACSVTLNLLVFFLARASAGNHWQLAFNLCLGLVLLLLANSHVQRLMTLIYAGALLHWYNRQLAILLLLSLASTIALLVKFSNGAAALGLFLPYLLAVAWRDGKPLQALVGLASVPVFYTLLWYAIYGHFAGMTGYIEGGLQFSRGSTSAMALNPANQWVAVAGFYLAVLAGITVLSRELRHGWAAMPLCFVGPLFIWSKYAFGREDGAHLGFLMAFAFYTGILWCMAARSWQNKLSCLLVLPLCFLSWKAMHNQETGPSDFSPKPVYYPLETFQYRWQHEELYNILALHSDKELAPLVLPPALRERIGDSTVDIYPWETLIAAANRLNWTPRPVYQSYISYTPFLDSANQRFYNSERAPEFIIWHDHSFSDIGTRFPFSSDPLTLQALLQHYRKLQCEGQFCLWQRVQENLLVTTPLPSSTTAQWNSWITVPDSDTDITRLHVAAQRTLAGKLNLALWKEGGIEIDYRLRDGSVRTHEVVLDNAASGLWVSPYMDSFHASNAPHAEDRNRLESLLQAPPAEGFIEKAELTPRGLQVLGWGLLPFKATKKQQLYLVLYNDTHAYAVRAENRARPGITAHFGKTGIVDLDTAGFDETFPVDNIVPGHYQIRFVVSNGGENAMSRLPSPSIDIAPVTRQGNVEAVRLRTSRPWAFADDLSIHWSTMDFTGERPW